MKQTIGTKKALGKWIGEIISITNTKEYIEKQIKNTVFTDEILPILIEFLWGVIITQFLCLLFQIFAKILVRKKYVILSTIL